MAYTIPVVALVFDPTEAARAIGYTDDFFEDPDEDRWEGVEELAKLTGAPVSSFSDEEGDLYYIGLQVESDFFVKIDDKLLAKAHALKVKYAHPLVQNAELAVVSEFN